MGEARARHADNAIVEELAKDTDMGVSVITPDVVFVEQLRRANSSRTCICRGGYVNEDLGYRLVLISTDPRHLLVDVGNEGRKCLTFTYRSIGVRQSKSPRRYERWMIRAVVFDALYGSNDRSATAFIEVRSPQSDDAPSALVPTLPDRLPTDLLSTEAWRLLDALLADRRLDRGPFSRLGGSTTCNSG